MVGICRFSRSTPFAIHRDAVKTSVCYLSGISTFELAAEPQKWVPGGDYPFMMYTATSLPKVRVAFRSPKSSLYSICAMNFFVPPPLFRCPSTGTFDGVLTLDAVESIFHSFFFLSCWSDSADLLSNPEVKELLCSRQLLAIAFGRCCSDFLKS